MKKKDKKGLGEAVPDEKSRVFLDSLEEMQETDYADVRRTPYAERTKKKRKTFSGVISTVFLLICAGVFCYCAYQIGIILIQYGEADDLYEDFSSQYRDAFAGADDVAVRSLSRGNVSQPMKNYSDISESGAEIFDPGTVSGGPQSLQFQQMLVFLGNLRQSNPDTYGYIDIDGTRVSYPLVQSGDNDFYLKHGFDGEALKAGAIYIDYRNSRHIEENRNTVIYGHNMESGAMFHSLINYKDEKFFRTKQIVITTFDGIYTFEVFSIRETVADDNYFRTWFTSDEDFISFCEREEALSKFHKEGITFTADSKIITLSTCITGVTDGRYAIHAVLVNVEK